MKKAILIALQKQIQVTTDVVTDYVDHLTQTENESDKRIIGALKTRGRAA
ncbi:MAG: hypothetical protein QNK37_08325 [Acidobacteriota bacterium]|nr:hypothetical protein [Acidobacteriota bacterium]